jgi:uncharacterized membrane protein YhaH (DUF805 family)
LKVLRQYTDFSGRARRKEYWYFALFNVIFICVAMVIDYAAGWKSEPGSSSFLPDYGSCYLIYMTATILPGFAVQVRRLHDLGKSGWWMLITLIPIAGLIWLMVLLCTDGQYERNRYGTNPKLVKPPFGEHSRPESIAAAWIAVVFIVCTAVTMFDYVSHFGKPWFFESNPPLFVGCTLLVLVFWIMFGAFFYPLGHVAARRRTAIVFLWMIALLNMLKGSYYLIRFHDLGSTQSMIYFLMLMAFAVVLFYREERRIGRKTVWIIAVALIVTVSTSALLHIVNSLRFQFNDNYFWIIPEIALISLAVYSLPRKAKKKPKEESPSQSDGREPDAGRAGAVAAEKATDRTRPAGIKKTVTEKQPDNRIISVEGRTIETDMVCKRCGQRILSRNKFKSELEKQGLRLNPQTNSITASGAYGGYADLAGLQRLSMKLEDVTALKCTACGKIYCLSCLANYAPRHQSSGGKACFGCGGSINYA